MDALTADLNPCSLETIPEPLRLRRRRAVTDKNKQHYDVWPLIVCCYQLDEAIGYRRGQLNLFHIAVPDITSDDPSLPLQFGTPRVVLEPAVTSGILDGKWSSSSSSSSRRFFATAHASGEIKLHQLRRTTRDLDSNAGDTDNNGDGHDSHVNPDEADERFTLEFVAQSNLPTEERGIPPLCL